VNKDVHIKTVNVSDATGTAQKSASPVIWL